ncbi:unnamed protein product [Closterium sp. Naga37s-1]|nr:unnamed protein product [Closterium sp. Naga37s-1]
MCAAAVAIGECDGQCSNDSQDMLEAVKMACIVNPVSGDRLTTPKYRHWLSPREVLRMAAEGGATAVGMRGQADPGQSNQDLTTPEYRHWLSPREVLRMAAEGGAAAVGMRGRAGAIKRGYVADAVLVDLTALSMLPRADPVGQLVLTRQRWVGCWWVGPGTGKGDQGWLRGRRCVGGSDCPLHAASSRPCGATGAHQTKVRGHGRVSEVAWVDEAVVERQHRQQ